MINIKKIESFKSYRFKENKKERELYKKFLKEFNENDLDFIVYGQKIGLGFNSNNFLSDHEKRIVVSTIQ